MLKEAYSLAYPESAICVQRFDDSLNSAIRITYRISLRSSSLREPRYPLLRVVLLFRKNFISVLLEYENVSSKSLKGVSQVFEQCTNGLYMESCDNDPSAGSPTETLLRLLLPLNDQV